MTNHDHVRSLKLIVPEDGSNFGAYMRHVRNYAPLSLTFRNDAYAAFEGITNSLFGIDSMHYGLPLAHFDRAMLWYTHLNEDKSSEREHGGICFPTWSWSSKLSSSERVIYPDDSFYGALTAWYQYDEASVDMLLAVNNKPDNGIESVWRNYMAIACSEGCVMSDSDSLPAQDTWTGSYAAPHKRWPDYQAFYQQLSGFRTEVPSDIRQTMRDTPGVLLGQAQSALFDLEVADYDPRRVEIIDSHDNIVGELHGRAIRIRQRLMPQEGSDYRDLCRFEFIALALSRKGERSDGDQGIEKTYVDVLGDGPSNAPVVEVMLIAWQGPIAYREALGWIYLVDWAASPRQWKTIILG